MPGDEDTNEISRLLRAFERATGFTICFRQFSPGWQTYHADHPFPKRFGQHANTFCMNVKHDFQEKCYEDCVYNLQKQSVTEPRGWVYRCHAGATELRMPVWSQDRLVGMLHLGPFREPGEEEQPRELPERSNAEIAWMRCLLEALRDRLERLLSSAPAPRDQPARDLLQRIENYVDSHIHDDPGRDEIARFLHKSPNWVSHFIRRNTGRTFQEIKDDRRLALARRLLVSGHLKIEAVAAEVGFRDPNYFYRFFRDKTGTTPAVYREKHGRPSEMI